MLRKFWPGLYLELIDVSKIYVLSVQNPSLQGNVGGEHKLN